MGRAGVVGITVVTSVVLAQVSLGVLGALDEGRK